MRVPRCLLPPWGLLRSSSYNKGTLSLSSTELVAGIAAPGREAPFAVTFAPGEGIQGIQLEPLMGMTVLRLCSRKGGGSLQSSHPRVVW